MLMARAELEAVDDIIVIATCSLRSSIARRSGMRRIQKPLLTERRTVHKPNETMSDKIRKL